MSNIRYFRAGSEDAEAVTELRLEVLAIFQGVQTPEAAAALRPQLLRAIYQGLKNNTYVCWLAEADSGIAGSGGMSIRQQPGNFTNPGGRNGYIMSMYTKPEHRGMGICTELVKRLISSGKEMGIEHFELHATTAGEPVYQKLGFLLHDEPTYRMHEKSHGGPGQEPETNIRCS